MSEITDLLERFRRAAEVVAVATTGASNQELDFTPGPGKWSVRQVACHLADFELACAIRIRQLLTEDNPTLMGYPEDLWAEGLDHKTRKISQAVESFRRVRAENHGLVKDLPESAFSRPGVHTERGPVTLGWLIRHGAEHAENHARQMMNIRQAYKAAKRNSS
ncbi:MAG: DinB family protein [Acidobacteria bacterium]|nr:DinB family protein [Acidobacteriota bacterium]